MSARAPHQVTVGGNLRFYGRGAKGNRPLTEREVARLYERRQSWAVDRERVLADVIANAPFSPREGLGYIHAFTRPVVADPGMLEQAFAALGDHRDVHQALLNAVHSTALRGDYSPSLEHANHFERRGADEWRFSNAGEQYDDFDKPGVVQAAVFPHMKPGRARSVVLRTRDRHPPQRRDAVHHPSGDRRQRRGVLRRHGAHLQSRPLHGHVDVGVALTGIQGAHSERRGRMFGLRDFQHSSEAFTRSARVAAVELAEPSVVAHSPLAQLLRGDQRHPLLQPVHGAEPSLGSLHDRLPGRRRHNGARP
jgi:hypothetical protein